MRVMEMWWNMDGWNSEEEWTKNNIQSKNIRGNSKVRRCDLCESKLTEKVLKNFELWGR